MNILNEKIRNKLKKYGSRSKDLKKRSQIYKNSKLNKYKDLLKLNVGK